jgi:hypothetical protein
MSLQGFVIIYAVGPITENKFKAIIAETCILLDFIKKYFLALTKTVSYLGFR